MKLDWLCISVLLCASLTLDSTIILRNKENYIYNSSGKYLSQYNTIYHMVACKKLVSLSIAYLLQDVKYWKLEYGSASHLFYMDVAIFTSDTVEADLKLLFVAFPFIISLFQLIWPYHMFLMTFIYSVSIQYIVHTCMHKSISKSVGTVLL